VRVDKATLEFMRMISSYREEHKGESSQHSPPGEHSICVVVRKRPQSKKEASTGDYDAVTTLNPRVVVHAPKLKVDGITKYLENTTFQFDHTFSDQDTTEDVYRYTVMPLVAYAFQKRGRGTCFAYGQTGSGKTYTMSGIQELVARDVFRALNSQAFKGKGLTVHASFFEIYGGRAFDVLHGRQMLQIRENEKQQVIIVGLQEVACADEAALLDVISRGNSSRTTHSTEVNEGSSRSHAICEVSLRTRDSGKVHGSLSLIDLAGSERAADSKNHNQQRRIESAEINKSLLGLKECIRALAVRAAMAANTLEGVDLPHVHVPFRASKLTLALRDSFVSPNSRVVMIATVSPNASGWDHTGNTLRYADRVKEQPTDLMGLGEGVGKGGGRETTFSFLESDRANASGMPSRVSPLTTDNHNGSGSGPNGIVEARAPPRPIFQRMKGVGAPVTSSEPSSFDVAKGAVQHHRSRVSRSSLNSGSDSAWSGKEGDEDDDSQGNVPAPVAHGGARRVLVQSQAQNERKVSENDEDDDAENDDVVGKRFVTKMGAPNPSRSSGMAGKQIGRKSVQSSSSSLDDSLESDVGGGGSANVSAPTTNKAPVPRQVSNSSSGSANAPSIQPPIRLIPEVAAAAQQIPGGGFKRLLQLGVSESISSQGPPPPPPPPPFIAFPPSESFTDETSAHVSSAPLPPSRNNAKDKLREKGRKAAAAAQQAAQGGAGVKTSRAATSARSSDDVSSSGSALYPPSSGAVVTRSMTSGAAATSSKPPPMSPEKRDLQLLHETLKREAKGSFKDLNVQQISEHEQDLELEFHEAVGIIYDEEQDLYNAHTSAITENSEVIEAESKLLVWMQSGEPDVDIGLYSARLRGLLERKIETAQRLMEKVISLQTHLAIEAEVSEARQNRR
jgi:kinesin family member 2/24